MPILFEGRVAGDWLKREADSHFSREEVVVASGQGRLQTGTVVGKLTATGKYVAVAATGADGSQTAAGIIVTAGDATSGDANAVIIARDAIVNHQMLLYGATVNDATKRAAVHTQLRALNPPILVREGA